MPPWIPLIGSWALPIGGVFLELLLMRVLSNRAKGWLAVFSAMLGFVALVSGWRIPLNGAVQDWILSAWDGPFSLIYRLDGLSFLFAFIALGVGSIILLFSIEYMICITKLVSRVFMPLCLCLLPRLSTWPSAPIGL